MITPVGNAGFTVLLQGLKLSAKFKCNCGVTFGSKAPHELVCPSLSHSLSHECNGFILFWPESQQYRFARNILLEEERAKFAELQKKMDEMLKISKETTA